MQDRTPFPPAPSAMSPGSNHRASPSCCSAGCSHHNLMPLRNVEGIKMPASTKKKSLQARCVMCNRSTSVLRRVHRRPGRARPHLPGDLQVAHEAGHQPQRVPQAPPGARARSRAPALATDRARAPPAPRLARARDRARVRARRRRLRGSRSGLRRARGQGAAHGMIARGRLIRDRHRDRER